MAEIIVAAICIAIGCIAALVALFVLYANAIGSVTAPGSVSIKPVIVLALVALAGIGGGVSLIVF